MKAKLASVLVVLSLFLAVPLKVNAQTDNSEIPLDPNQITFTVTYPDGSQHVLAPEDVINGDCNVTPEMEWVGLPRDLDLNEVAVDILVKIDGRRVCWFVWGTWPGSPDKDKARLYVDSLVVRSSNQEKMYDPHDYKWEGVPSYPGVPPHYHDEWAVTSRISYEQFDIQVKAYERQMLTNVPESQWPGAEIDASAYVRVKMYNRYLPIIEKHPPTTPPPCQVTCLGWGIQREYRSETLGWPLAESLDLKQKTNLGWLNVTRPDYPWYTFTYNGIPTTPPKTGYFVNLYRETSSGWSLVRDYHTNIGSDGNWTVTCDDLGNSIIPHLLQGGFYVVDKDRPEECGIKWCAFEQFMKDPPAAAAGYNIMERTMNGYFGIPLAVLLVLPLLGFALYNQRRHERTQ